MSLDFSLLEMRETESFSANITHNLAPMAREAGIYQHLWRPEEVGITEARHLVEVLTNALSVMETDPERFKRLNPENGWGDYGGFVNWVRDVRDACVRHPDAKVYASR